MRQHSFLKFFAFWNGGFRVAPASEGRWQRPAVRPSSACASTPAATFSPEQLDHLSVLLAPGGDDAFADRSPLWVNGAAAIAGRQERFLRTVDRAIAEIAGPRGRRKRPRW